MLLLSWLLTLSVFANAADYNVDRERAALFAPPTYTPDANGIDTRFKDFKIEDKRLAIMYISAFLELQSTANLRILSGAEKEGQLSVYSPMDHFFDDRVSMPHPMKIWWRTYLNMFPMSSEVNSELMKIETIRELETLRSKYVRGEVDEIAIREVIEKVPGNSTRARDQYLEELEITMRPDVQALRRQLAIEVRLAQAVTEPVKLHSMLQIETHISRIQNDLQWSDKAQYYFWSKLTPIMSDGQYRYYYDSMSSSRIGRVKFNGQVSLRFYISTRDEFEKGFLENALPMQLIALTKAALSWQDGGRAQKAIDQLMTSMSQFLIDNEKTLPTTSRYAIKRSLLTAQQLIEKKGMKWQVVSTGWFNSNSFYSLVKLADANFRFSVEGGSTVTASNFTRIMPLDSSAPFVSSGSFSGESMRMSFSYSAADKKVEVTMRCHGATLGWSKRLGLVKNNGVEMSPIECGDDGVRLRELEDRAILNAIIVKGSGDAQAFFQDVLGNRNSQ